jgi:RNA polymerase sigma factor (sigma-70 family)
MTNEELCRMAASGDNNARDELWKNTEGVFRTIANRLYCRYRKRAAVCGQEYSDCCSVCWFAFLNAVRDYSKKPEQEYKFTTFAGLHVKQQIYYLLGMQKTKREPLDYALSIDAPIFTDGGNVSIADTVADTAAELPYTVVDDTDLSRQILERVARLPPSEHEIIYRHYWKSKSFSQIAADIGEEPPKVYTLYRKALHQLRRDARIQQIHAEFYNVYNFHKRTGYTAFRESGASSVEAAILKLEERGGLPLKL